MNKRKPMSLKEALFKKVQHYAEQIFPRVMRILTGRTLPVRFKLGRDSYTDHKQVVVSIEDTDLDKGEIKCWQKTKFLLWHEMGHNLFTSQSQYSEMVKSIMNTFEEYIKGIGKFSSIRELIDISADLANSLCDGRMENCLVNKYPNSEFVDFRRIERLEEWQSYTIARKHELTDIRNNILTIATMGYYLQGWEDIYSPGERAFDICEAAIEPITGYVEADTIKEGTPYAVEVAKLLAPVIADYFSYDTMEEADSHSIPEDLRDLVEEIKEAYENGTLNTNQDGTEMQGNGPVIALLTDDEENEPDAFGPMRKPDAVIDLRKKKKEEKAEEGKEEGKGGASAEGTEEETNGGTEGNTEESTGENTGVQSGSPSGDSEYDTEDNYGGEAGDDKEPGEYEGSTEADPPDSSPDDDSSDNSLESKPFPEDSKPKGSKEADMKKAITEALARAEEAVEEQISRDASLSAREIKAAEKIEEDKGRDVIGKDDMDWIKDAGLMGWSSEINPREARRIHRKAPGNVQAQGRTWGRKLLNIIAQKQRYSLSNLSSGRFDKKKVNKVVTGKYTQDYNMFMKKGSKVEPDMVFSIKVDQSGSMCGIQQEAVRSVAMAEEIIRTTGCPLRISDFHGGNRYESREWKGFDDNEAISYAMSYAERPGGGNNDALAIAEETRRLLKRPEKHKVLIVISDGSPSDCSEEQLEKAVQTARKEGIFVISFFIGSAEFIEASWESYRKWYKNHFCGVSPEKMGEAMAKFLKNYIQKCL